MKVVFVEDVKDVAHAGEVKNVADGYARNYLLPKKLAAPATPQQLNRLEARQQADARREAKLGARAGDLASKLSGATVVIDARAGTQDRLYGSITSADIAEQLAKLAGEPVDRRKIRLEDPIRRLGQYQVDVHLTKDVDVTINVVVQSQGRGPQPAAEAVAGGPAEESELSEEATEGQSTPAAPEEA